MQTYFLSGGSLPTIALLLPEAYRFWGVVAAVTLSLTAFGTVAARLGGTKGMMGSVRMVLGGWLAMGCTVLVGKLFGADPA
jgi:vacuolar iron transporter family protein